MWFRMVPGLWQPDEIHLFNTQRMNSYDSEKNNSNQTNPLLPVGPQFRFLWKSISYTWHTSAVSLNFFFFYLANISSLLSSWISLFGPLQGLYTFTLTYTIDFLPLGWGPPGTPVSVAGHSPYCTPVLGTSYSDARICQIMDHAAVCSPLSTGENFLTPLFPPWGCLGELSGGGRRELEWGDTPPMISWTETWGYAQLTKSPEGVARADGSCL